MSPSPDVLLRVPHGVLEGDLEDAILLLPARGLTIREISGAGAAVWRMLREGPRTAGELLMLLQGTYVGDREEMRRDLDGLLEGLLASGLLVAGEQRGGNAP